MTERICNGTHARHWYKDGNRDTLPNCIRCGATNPRWPLTRCAHYVRLGSPRALADYCGVAVDRHRRIRKHVFTRADGTEATVTKSKAERPLTVVERRVLTILFESEEPMMAQDVARQLWPDAKGWSVYSNAGDRGQMGGAAGLILRRLQRRGLVSVSDPLRERGTRRYLYAPHFSATLEGRKVAGGWAS